MLPNTQDGRLVQAMMRQAKFLKQISHLEGFFQEVILRRTYSIVKIESTTQEHRMVRNQTYSTGIHYCNLGSLKPSVLIIFLQRIRFAFRILKILDKSYWDPFSNE